MKSYEHFDRLQQQISETKTRVAELEAEVTAAHDNLSAVLANPESAAKELGAAKARVPRAEAALAEGKSLLSALQAAADKALVVADEAAKVETAAYHEKQRERLLSILDLGMDATLQDIFEADNAVEAVRAEMRAVAIENAKRPRRYANDFARQMAMGRCASDPLPTGGNWRSCQDKIYAIKQVTRALRRLRGEETQDDVKLRRMGY